MTCTFALGLRIFQELTELRDEEVECYHIVYVTFTSFPV